MSDVTCLEALTVRPVKGRTPAGTDVILPVGTLTTVLAHSTRGNDEWWTVCLPRIGVTTIDAAALMPLPDELGAADLFPEPYDHERDGL